MSRGVSLLLGSVGTQAPACTHSRTEFSPFAFTSSPRGPLCLKKRYLRPGFQFTKQINLSPSDAQELVFATCMVRPGSAEVLEHGETLQNDPAQFQILCFVRVFEKIVIMDHFEHT